MCHIYLLLCVVLFAVLQPRHTYNYTAIVIPAPRLIVGPLHVALSTCVSIRKGQKKHFIARTDPKNIVHIGLYDYMRVFFINIISVPIF